MEKYYSNCSKNNTKLENENIIVWLDFAPYAYINFGIISALSKLDKFNLIGIVATQDDLDFFRNQQLISFKELVYYPECYINKSSFNLDKLKNFEKQYDLNLWLDVFAERYFYKYLTRFHKFTKKEILTILENSISFFVDILERTKPKLILMQQAGENISNLLFYQLAKKLEIKILMPNQVYLRNKILISDNIRNVEISNEFKKLLPTFDNSSDIYDQKFIKNEDRSESIYTLLHGPKFKKNLFQSIDHYLKRLSHDPESIYLNVGKTKLKMIKYQFQTRIEAKKRKQFLDNNSLLSIKDEKFLYFPLATEPEARILTTSPFYTNQISLIENIAKSIPIDYLLYVKEHPVQELKTWRAIDDYKKIINIPNVRLVHPSVNNRDLISKSQGVIAISGGTGFEALFYKKPVILFVDEYYDVLSMVTKVKTFDTLPNDIRHALSNFKFSVNELNAFMHVFNSQTLSVPYHSIMNDGSIIAAIQRTGHNYELTSQYFLKFYEKYKNYFELIAQRIQMKL